MAALPHVMRRRGTRVSRGFQLRPAPAAPGGRAAGRGVAWGRVGVAWKGGGIAPLEAEAAAVAGTRRAMSSGHPAAPSAAPGGSPGIGGDNDPHFLPPNRRRRRGPAPRPPSVPAAAGADVFVTARTDFRAQLRRCQRLLAPGGPGGGRGGPAGPPPGELRLHGLGLAVPRAINLALQLQAGAAGALRLHASTSSVALPPPGAPRRRRGPPRAGEGDDDEEEEEEEEGGAASRPRHNSAIHIRVCREAPCA
ncbi:ribonuclease P protein subunit p20 [Opisthocomus hoazin]|uniref:ribonuclease P protein subunit p20 n=1 Tax=Opisthocomus hoazin TaxID=30419 RepID=UPI003F53065F